MCLELRAGAGDASAIGAGSKVSAGAVALGETITARASEMRTGCADPAATAFARVSIFGRGTETRIGGAKVRRKGIARAATSTARQTADFSETVLTRSTASTNAAKQPSISERAAGSATYFKMPELTERLAVPISILLSLEKNACPLRIFLESFAARSFARAVRVGRGRLRHYRPYRPRVLPLSRRRSGR